MRTRDASDKHIWTKQWLSSTVENELKTLEYSRVQEEINAITHFLPKNGRILEAGCGLGRWVLCLRRCGYDIVGVDWSQETIDQIKAFDDSAPVQIGDVRSLPFADSCFRGILSFGVIEHFADGPERILKEMHRVLERKGILILTVPLKNVGKKLAGSFSVLPGLSSRRRVNEQSSKRSDILFEKPLKLKDLSSVLEDQGFEIISCMPIGHSFTLWECSLIFRRYGEYYRENRAAEVLGKLLSRFAAWSTAYSVLIVGEKK